MGREADRQGRRAVGRVLWHNRFPPVTVPRVPSSHTTENLVSHLYVSWEPLKQRGETDNIQWVSVTTTARYFKATPRERERLFLLECCVFARNSTIVGSPGTRKPHGRPFPQVTPATPRSPSSNRRLLLLFFNFYRSQLILSHMCHLQ